MPNTIKNPYNRIHSIRVKGTKDGIQLTVQDMLEGDWTQIFIPWKVFKPTGKVSEIKVIEPELDETTVEVEGGEQHD